MKHLLPRPTDSKNQKVSRSPKIAKANQRQLGDVLCSFICSRRCGDSGADLSKIGAATYRGPTATTSSTGTADAAKQSSRLNRDLEPDENKAAVSTVPIQPADYSPGAEAVGNGFYATARGTL